ncbi:MAG: hypothetical protein E6Q88_00785 [Lysobacteraceae bacterium]|nr:MAG: hypothetical protein E6Q88_00785 [Xanthomonadaceae bacterium]
MTKRRIPRMRVEQIARDAVVRFLAGILADRAVRAAWATPRQWLTTLFRHGPADRRSGRVDA